MDGMNVGKIGGMSPVAGSRPSERVGGTEAVGKSFQDVLLESIERVERLEAEAETAMRQVQGGGVEAARAALAAARKADVAFQTLMQIHGRIMEAYREVNEMRFS